MKTKLIFSAFIIQIIAVLIGGASPVGAEITNRVVAIVNNDVITLYELNAKMREMTGVEPTVLRTQNERKYLEARRRVLDLLINDRITQNKVDELGIKVTEGQVDEAIERVKRINHWTHEDLIAALKRQGISYHVYRENMRKNMERARLINYEVKSKIIISEKEIRDYYDQHRNEFRTDAKVHLATIILKRENPSRGQDADEAVRKGKMILSKIKAGEAFEKLAKEFSQGPGAKDGGDLGFFNPSQLDPKLKEIVDAMSVGGVSELIIRPSAVQIVKLLEKQETREKPLEEVRDHIHDILYRDEVNKMYSSWIKRLREKAYTKIIF